MPTYVRQYFGRSALRNSDRRLMPAIIACNLSICFLLFGVFLTISGIIFRSVASSSSYETGSFNQGSSPSDAAVTAGTVILSLGAILLGIGLALLIFAWITFKRFQEIRTQELTNNSASNLNLETSFGVTHYRAPPIQTFSTIPPTQVNAYRSERLYTIQDEFEPPPSYSTLEENHPTSDTLNKEPTNGMTS